MHNMLVNEMIGGEGMKGDGQADHHFDHNQLFGII